MLKATSYRYENIKENKSLSEALRKQKDMVAYEEKLASDEKERKQQELLEKKSKWIDSSEGTVNFKRNRNRQKEVTNEIDLAAKTTLEVRQKKLRKLFLDEWKVYENELNKVGLAFFIQRI